MNSQLNIAARGRIVSSGVTPIEQGWTNARGLRGLGGPEPDPKKIVYNYLLHVALYPFLCIYSN